jgi:hypothetical protein
MGLAPGVGFSTNRPIVKRQRVLFSTCDEFNMLRQQLYAGIGTRLFLGGMCMVRVLSTCVQPTTVPQRLQRNTSQMKDSGTGGDGGRYCRGSGACSNPLCRRDVRSLLQPATPFNALQCLEMARTHNLLGQASASHARQQCACWTYTSGDQLLLRNVQVHWVCLSDCILSCCLFTCCRHACPNE